MRIERISDTQMKFVLMSTDLEERDIKLSELSHSSDKTQRLFREIIQIAQDEGAFTSESTPYLMEAARVGVDGLAVVVTKLDAEDMERFNITSNVKNTCRFKRAPLIEQPEYTNEDSHSVFSFVDLDMAALATHAIYNIFSGESQLYKLNGQYYLWLLNETMDDRTTDDLEAVMLEFGQKHVSNVLSRQYLAEHGELIFDDAVDKLNLYI